MLNTSSNNKTTKNNTKIWQVHKTLPKSLNIKLIEGSFGNNYGKNMQKNTQN